MTENILSEQVKPVRNLVKLNHLEILSQLGALPWLKEVHKSVRVDFSTLPNLSDVILGCKELGCLSWPHTAWEGELQSITLPYSLRKLLYNKRSTVLHPFLITFTLSPHAWGRSERENGKF